MEKYFAKSVKTDFKDIYWNLPEQKRGVLGVLGGHAGQFRTAVKVAEYAVRTLPVAEVKLALPRVLEGKVPSSPDIAFLTATESGSFADGNEIGDFFGKADANMVVGDLSKNVVTGRVVTEVLESVDRPTVITRDTVDLVTETGADGCLMNPAVTVVGSVAQLSKMLRAIYYPKMLLMSQSLVQVAEVLHKLTLSYPAGIATFHDGQIVVAIDGEVRAVPIAETEWTVLTLWGGELAARMVCYQMFNPGDKLGATVAAVLG